MPKIPIVVGSYHRLRVSLQNVKLQDVNFIVPEGPIAGTISPSRDSTFNAELAEIMLCVGCTPGKYSIEARHANTNAVIGSAKFETGTTWLDDTTGPTKWFTGTSERTVPVPGWGGGDLDNPENMGVMTKKRWRIAILLVETTTQSFSVTDLPRIRTEWMNEVINGAVQAGVTRSARAFYREVSYGQMDIEAEIFGPFALTGSFDDFFYDRGEFKAQFPQACITAAGASVDFAKFDTVACVSQSISANPSAGVTARNAWPYASLNKSGPYTTSKPNEYLMLGVISMPHNWAEVDTGNRAVCETFSHELAHNLGLDDLYRPRVGQRNVGAWDPMHFERNFPHFSLAHRMRLGWVDKDWLELFNFQKVRTREDRTVTLYPVETKPTVGKIGIEVRVTKGRNYYFEYRNSQATQIGDQSLPLNNRVLVTDVVAPNLRNADARPDIILPVHDQDGDGSVLGNGQDFEDKDTTALKDFVASVSGIDGTKADVRIQYGANSKPDLSITPWPLGGDNPFQSPDIEVRNPRSIADKAWFNVPWLDNDNTIVARIRNEGKIDAPGVRVNFYVKEVNVSGEVIQMIPKGFDIRDVPADSEVEFQCPNFWRPIATDGHFCISVAIVLYQSPDDPTVVEVTEFNNVADSNYFRFISATSTPSRERMTVKVGNSYPVRTRVWINARQNNPLYRTYLQYAWLYLDPGEVRSFEVMFEYAPDNLTNGIYPQSELGKIGRQARLSNAVSFTTCIEDPFDIPRRRKYTLGGLQAEIVTGRSTTFSEFDCEAGKAWGTVVTKEDKVPVRGGKVILRIASEKGPAAIFSYKTVSLRNGAFEADVGGPGKLIKAFYIPAPGFADTESKERKLL
jgi:M6 family metalloprotease-like protein